MTSRTLVLEFEEEQLECSVAHTAARKRTLLATFDCASLAPFVKVEEQPSLGSLSPLRRPTLV